MDLFFGLDKPATLIEGVAVLTTVYGNAELCIIRSILESEGIPYRVRDRGAGGVVRLVTGDSAFGSDILVPEEKLEEATQLLEAFQSAELVEDAGENTDGEDAT
jgi:hypothetical protein